MSTATINSALDTGTELFTLARVTFDTGEKDNNNESVLDNVAVSEKEGEKAKTEGKISLKVKGKVESYDVIDVTNQSFTSYRANTLSGIEDLCPSDEEKCNIFNRDITRKQAAAAKSLIEADDFTFTEESYDLKPVIGEVTNRRLSPTEKAMETIKALPPEQRAQLMAALAALQS